MSQAKIRIYLDDVDITTLPQPMTSDEIKGDWDFEVDNAGENLYTLLIYDQDAPYPDDPYNSPFIHYLAINMPRRKNIVMSWFLPQPPRDSPEHRYVAQLYHQERILPKFYLMTRTKFPLDDFIQQHQLSFVDEMTFRVVSE